MSTSPFCTTLARMKTISPVGTLPKPKPPSTNHLPVAGWLHVLCRLVRRALVPTCPVFWPQSLPLSQYTFPCGPGLQSALGRVEAHSSRPSSPAGCRLSLTCVLPWVSSRVRHRRRGRSAQEHVFLLRLPLHHTMFTKRVFPSVGKGSFLFLPSACTGTDTSANLSMNWILGPPPSSEPSGSWEFACVPSQEHSQLCR